MSAATRLAQALRQAANQIEHDCDGNPPPGLPAADRMEQLRDRADELDADERDAAVAV